MLITSVLQFYRINLRKTHHAHIKHISSTGKFYRDNL